MKLKEKKGFTLIELIIVIVILGILAAVAIPKFAGMSGDAKKAAVKGLAGAVSSAANIAHSKWLISPASTITMEGESVAMYNGDSAPGYPSEVDGGINKALTYDTDKFNFDGGTNENNDNASFKLNNKDDCAVYYGVSSDSFVVYTKTDGCE